MEGIQDAYEQEFSEPALLPENCLDDSNRQIFLLPKEMMDFWPSLINEHEPNMDGTGMYSEAISLAQMLEASPGSRITTAGLARQVGVLDCATS